MLQSYNIKYLNYSHILMFEIQKMVYFGRIKREWSWGNTIEKQDFCLHCCEKIFKYSSVLSEVAGCDSENSPILRQKGSGKAEFYPSPKKFYILLFFQQPGLQSFESTQLTKGWLSQTLHLNKGPGKERWSSSRIIICKFRLGCILVIIELSLVHMQGLGICCSVLILPNCKDLTLMN